jgi:hypothetical protein
MLPDNLSYEPPVKITTATAKEIMWGGILTRSLDDFLKKNADYEDASDALHIIGQVSDLYRKVIKLKKAVIDGKPLNGETVASLLQDVFGHALLGMYYESMRSPVEEDQFVSVVKDGPSGKYYVNGREITEEEWRAALPNEDYKVESEKTHEWHSDTGYANAGETMAKNAYMRDHGFELVPIGPATKRYQSKEGNVPCAAANPINMTWCTRLVHLPADRQHRTDGLMWVEPLGERE